MTKKTAIASPEKPEVCDKCGTGLTYSPEHGRWFCKACLYGAFLTHQAQQEATRRYRQSEKGKNSEKKYEQTERGKATREKYLKSEKYKQRRKEYNQRLKESLQIARAAHLERASAAKPSEVVRDEEMKPLIQDIQEYVNTMGHEPSTSEVVTWSLDVYGMKGMTTEQAQTLIEEAKKKRR
jgi:uncharacterized Zn finger protein (UPF0148 family)